jgi:hypothetical protein
VTIRLRESAMERLIALLSGFAVDAVLIGTFLATTVFIAAP